MKSKTVGLINIPHLEYCRTIVEGVVLFIVDYDFNFFNILICTLVRIIIYSSWKFHIFVVSIYYYYYYCYFYGEKPTSHVNNIS